MKKYFLIINFLMFIMVSIFNGLYIQSDLLLHKSIASICFVAISIINLIYILKSNQGNKKFCYTMVIGLFFAMLGDILLERIFLLGAVFFAIGHIIYFISYCFIEKINKIDILISAPLSLISAAIVAFIPVFKFDSIMLEIVCVIYAIIISFMVGKTIANLIKRQNVFNFLLVIGSVLFFFSDLMLLLSNFGHISTGHLCLATYYPAQCILAFSLLYSNQK